MQYRRLGRTGLMVSVVGFGGVSIQRIPMEASTAVIRRAHDVGMNIIDSAHSYTDSEEKIGEGIAPHRHDWIVATKTLERSRDGVKRDLATSLEKLKTDHIDIYQVHWLNDEEILAQVLKRDGAVAAMREAQAEGLVRFVGLSAHSAEIAIKAVKTGEFDTVQFPFNAVEREKGELLNLARSMDVGTIIMKPLAGGNFTNARLALKFVMAEGADTAIPGMESIAQVEENAAIGMEGSDLSPEELRLIMKEAEELGEGFCRRCGYCMRGCPVGMDIPGIFTADNMYLRYHMQEHARSDYAGFDHHADECTECGACEDKCPYNLPIREKLKAAHLRLA